jgi:hypothetical protein
MSKSEKKNIENVSTKKKLKRLVKKATNKELITKVIIIVSSLALLSSAVIPFIVR